MAVPHYAYLKLKMPGSAGVLTINGSFIKSDQCDRDFYRISDTFGAEQELREIAMVTDKSTFPFGEPKRIQGVRTRLQHRQRHSHSPSAPDGPGQNSPRVRPPNRGAGDDSRRFPSRRVGNIRLVHSRHA